nr:splicing factor u2af-associated protein 2 [Quercus suber]
MAIQMLDDSDFRPGKKDPNGPMRVEVADPSRRAQKDKVYSNDEVKEKGSNAYRDRAKAIRKREELNARISNWDEDEEPQTLRPPKTSRFDKIVVIKRMFTPEDAKDPVEMMEIERELREEAEKHGQVSRVLLYDKEADGVATVRFVDEQAARACAATFSARRYDGQPVEAYIATGNERFKKSEKGEEADDEDARLEAAVRATQT